MSEMLRLYHGSATLHKERDGVFGINPVVDVNLSNCRHVAEGAAVFDAAMKGVKEAKVYVLETSIGEVRSNSNYPCWDFIRASGSGWQMGQEERLAIVNYGSTVRVPEDCVPQVYKESEYVRGQNRYATEVARPRVDFFYTWIDPNRVIDVLSVDKELIEELVNRPGKKS